MKVYACYNNDLGTRLASSSGGVFTPLAEEVLKNNGAVYGVAMTDDCYAAQYIRITDVKDLALLRGSKYMQAQIGKILKNVKDDLLIGKKVLFSGTACQISGLKKYLWRDYDNLITVDVICHGVPSQKLWRRYVEHQEYKFGSKLKHVNFRCKDDSWEDFGMKENELYSSKDTDPFMQMFLLDYCLRPSCYNCLSKKEKVSDITIADFWGIDRCAPFMNDGNGTSLVIIRTMKGEQLFNDVKTYFKIKEVSYKNGIRKNPAEHKSPMKPKERESFYLDMESMDFDSLARKYVYPKHVSIKAKIIKKIKRIVQSVIRGGKKR